MSEFYTALKDFLAEQKWEYEELQDQEVLRFGVEGQNATLNCYAQINDSAKQFIFYTQYREPVPEDYRLKVSEFISRANANLILGNFELDFKDGELRYRTSVIYNGIAPSSALFSDYIFTNVVTMDRLVPTVSEVITTDLKPEDAIGKIEG